MMDSYARRIIDPPLNLCASYLAKTGLSANSLTFTGFGISLLGFIALTMQAYEAAIASIVISRLIDGLDGPLARQTKATDLGGFLDIVSDFVFYAGTVFFFAVGRPDVALPAAFLIFSFMATGSSFLAYAIMAAKNGQNHSAQGHKSFFYLQGLAEGTETIIVMILLCLLPQHFTTIAYIYGAMCWLTFIGRVRRAMMDYRNEQDQEPQS